jgi:hypothetical protein
MHAKLYWKTAKEKLHGGPRHRWDDNIKMGLKEIGCGMNLYD